MSMVMELHLEAQDIQRRLDIALNTIESCLNMLREGSVSLELLEVPSPFIVGCFQELEKALSEAYMAASDALTDERPAIALPEAVK